MAANDVALLQDQDHEALRIFDTWLVGSVHSTHQGVQVCRDSELRAKITLHQLCGALTIIDKDPQSYVVLRATGPRSIPMAVKDKPIILIAVQKQGDLMIKDQPLNGRWTTLHETADLTGSGAMVVLVIQ